MSSSGGNGAAHPSRFPAAAGFVSAAACLLLSAAVQGQETASPAEVAARQLGEALFVERNFTNPGADYGASCGECHVDGSRSPDRPERSFADSVPLSLLAGKTTTLRNTPTLIDAASWRSDRDGAWRGGWDGAASDLDQLIFDKLIGPLNGWSTADRARALAAVQLTLASEAPATGASYAQRFHDAYGLDVSAATAEESVRAAARALAAYLTTLESTHTAHWDAFAEQNRLRTGPNEGQSAQDYSFFLDSRIGNQEGRGLIKRPEGFSEEAYRGFRIFFRTLPDQLDETAGVGQCVTCHTPPSFRDGRFHNAGVAELEYDAHWGAGAADQLAITDTQAARPTPEDRTAIDLGRIVVAPQEEGARGAFKTPTLRNLSGTGPYMHNGAYPTLEEVIRAKILASERARAGQLQHADPAIAEIRLSPADIAPLVAFLRQLDDVGSERFRYYLIHFDP